MVNVTKVEQVENKVERENEVAVTVLSAHGEDALGRLRNSYTVRDIIIGAQGRNHSSIADSKVAQRIVPTILTIEQYDNERGDIGR